MKQLLLILTVIFSVGLTAQEIKVSVVNDNTKQPLPGTSILVKGTSKGTSTDADGKYIISAAVGDILHLLLLDMKQKCLGSTVNVTLAESGELLQDVVVLGSRSAPRTVTESAVPDVISMKEISSQAHK
jgi:iron complex outermembrane receptor protein